MNLKQKLTNILTGFYFLIFTIFPLFIWGSDRSVSFSDAMVAPFFIGLVSSVIVLPTIASLSFLLGAGFKFWHK